MDYKFIYIFGSISYGSNQKVMNYLQFIQFNLFILSYSVLCNGYQCVPQMYPRRKPNSM